MAVYDLCGFCKGGRSVECTDCRCSRCKGSRRVDVTCTKCNGFAKITCERCQGAGQLLKKKGWVSDTYEECWKCRGSRQQPCSCGSGKVSSKCPSCQGTGRNSECIQCGGTGQVKCSNCDGLGTVLSQWYLSLGQMPVEDLKSENEKRQRQIPNLRMKILRLEVEYQQTQADWNEAYNQSRADPGWDAGGFQRASTSIMQEIRGCEGEISRLEAEINALEEAVASKKRS